MYLSDPYQYLLITLFTTVEHGYIEHAYENSNIRFNKDYEYGTNFAVRNINLWNTCITKLFLANQIHSSHGLRNEYILL